MNYYDVSRDDEMVVDSDGTIWVAQPGDMWAYLGEDGLATWDEFRDLPEQYTYAKLDEAARKLIRRGLARR